MIIKSRFAPLQLNPDLVPVKIGPDPKHGLKPARNQVYFSASTLGLGSPRPEATATEAPSTSKPGGLLGGLPILKPPSTESSLLATIGEQGDFKLFMVFVYKASQP